ncbi:MAG: hypothetical protein NTY34_04035 [Candidatus Omnitrophica bacterium]|nr:hypothetical protein [Candidatus Omnitrophota bacterium]
MRNKKLIAGIIVLIAFVGIILFSKAIATKAKAMKTTASAAQVKKNLKKTAAQKVISKGKGGLTVRIVNSKNVEIPMRIKTFRVIDAGSSVYAASLVGGRMQEVTPGTYDLEVDSVPQKIFKNIKVAEGRETIEDLGCVTGSITVRTLSAKKTAAYYPMRVLYSRTNDMVTAYMTNKTMEIVPGVYDIEIGTYPRLYKKDIRVIPGKEVIIDMGCVAGSLTVKTVNENGKNVRSSVRITRADTNEVASSTTSNKPIDLGKGAYNIEVLSNPRQSKKDVKVNVGEESVAEFIISAPIVPQRSIKPVVVKPVVKVKQQ